MSHSLIDAGDTEQVTYRFTPRQMHLIRKVRKSRPFIRSNSEAVRYIFDLVDGIPEPVYIKSELALRSEIKQFHNDVKAVVKSIQNLRSCLAGDMTPESFADVEMQRIIADLRAQALVLPDKLRQLQAQAFRMGELLQIGLTKEELTAVRYLQDLLTIWLRDKDAKISKQSDNKELLVEHFRDLEIVQPLIDRIFGPAPEANG